MAKYSDKNVESNTFIEINQTILTTLRRLIFEEINILRLYLVLANPQKILSANLQPLSTIIDPRANVSLKTFTVISIQSMTILPF